jgi:hypothetical protein
MQLRMISRGTWEELQVELLDGSSTIVGQLKGIYIVRGPGAFLDACCSGAIEEDSPASNFVDADGCPTSCWKHRVSARASGGGLLFLEQLVIEQTTVHDVASDFVRAVLQILGGPMKRVTLALWTDGMGSTVGRGETAPLRDLCAGIGFQSVAGDSEILYMEVEARSMRSGKTKVVRKAAAKRKREEDANKENDAISVQRPLKQGKMDSMQQFPRQPAYSITFDGSVTAVGDLNIPSATWDKLTPRIRQNLSTAAATGIMALKADAARFTSGKQGGCYWGCKSFPPQLRRGVFKAYVKGFAEVVSIIGSLLQSRQAPTVDLINRIISPFAGKAGQEFGLQLNKHFVSHFLGVGGTVRCALMAVIEEAATLHDIYEAVNNKDTSAFATHESVKEYHALPIHMLDGDFEFVRSVLIRTS